VGSSLVSLWEIMEEYRVGDLTLILVNLARAALTLSASDKRSGKVYTGEYRDNLIRSLDALAITARDFNADPSLIQQICSFRDSLKGDTCRREV
jgi:hypothetical protein